MQPKPVIIEVIPDLKDNVWDNVVEELMSFVPIKEETLTCFGLNFE